MNVQVRSTTKYGIPEFPLPASNQCPADDLAIIASSLRIVALVIEEGSSRGIAARDAGDLLCVISEVMSMFRPIQLFLDELDDTTPLYRECRRRVIVEANARAAA
jgi:hypothetical protein